MNTFKTLLYMGSMHGFFTYYFPYRLVLLDVPLFSIGYFHLLAFAFWITGTLAIIWCSVDFVRKGHGTPAHINPPKSLIVNGPYQYVRNPIYVGALLVQVGYVLWFGSRLTALYSLLFFQAFQMLVVFVEEPILRNTFGAAYDEYSKRVPRWVPRILRAYS